MHAGPTRAHARARAAASPLPTAQNAAKGQGVLRVSNSSAFAPGQWVRLVMSAPAAGGVVTDMMAGIIPEAADFK